MIPISVTVNTLKTEAFSMQYIRFGSGEKSMVILPGLSVQSVMPLAQDVAKAYEIFSEQYTVYLFDRRAELPEEYTVRDMALDTAKAMDALGLKDVDLFGVSQGGMMALVIAIERGDLVHRLALGSTTSRVSADRAPALNEWVRLAEAQDGPGLYLAFGREVYPPAMYEQFKDALRAAGESVTAEDFRRFVILTKGMNGFNVTDRLTEIRCPVLVIGEMNDQVLDSDDTMEIAVKLDDQPGFRLFMYAGYGHAAYDTAPDYKQRVYRFFDA